jgi:hypothetical protein
MSQRLKHALHNEDVCAYLGNRLDYADWVITTAFYSALHFVEHKVFPFTHTVNGTPHVINNINDYKRINPNKTKHELRYDLVIWKCQAIQSQYKWLWDTCSNARYYDYKFPNSKVTIGLANSSLKDVKKFCK